MFKKCLAALVVIVVAFLVLPARASEAHTVSDKDAAKFADDVLDVADAVASNYFIEIAKAELVETAVRGLYRRSRSDISPDVQDRLSVVAGMKDAMLRDLLVLARKDIEPLSNDRALDLALEEMMKRLDGKSEIRFGNPPIICGDSGSAEVGLRLRTDPATGMLAVVTPLLGGPAYKAGIQAGDLIQRITLFEDASGDRVKAPRLIPAKDLPPVLALRRMQGIQGTRVSLLTQRPGDERTREYLLERSHVQKETVLGYRRRKNDSWDCWIDKDRKLAYIRLVELGENTPDQLKSVLQSLQKQEVQGLILDFRFCPGGLLSAAVDISDLFVEEGAIVSIRSVRIPEEIIRSRGDSQVHVPMVCLVNEETARPGEVVAACLQDHHRAVIVGERTRGACAIFSTISLPKVNGYLSLTRKVLCRPNGKKLYKCHMPDGDDDEWGVSPDPKYALHLPTSEKRDLADFLDRQTWILPTGPEAKEKAPDFKDRQLEMALEYLRTQCEKP